MKSKRKFNSEFKAKVAIEAIKEQLTLSELSAKYELQPCQISKWKRELLEKSALVYSMEEPDKKQEKELQSLYEQIGKLQVANDFLKKKLY